MPRFLMGWILGLVGAAIGLVVCWLIFRDDFTFSSFGGFVLAIIAFAILSAIIGGIVRALLNKYADAIVALAGLISTFLALLVTSWFKWLTITGTATWFWSTLIVWLLSMVIWLVPGPWRKYRREGRATAR